MSADGIEELLLSQNGRCVLTGRALLTGSLPRGETDRATVALIDHQLGNVAGNVRLLTRQAANARQFWTDEQLFSFCMDVLKTQGYSVTKP